MRRAHANRPRSRDLPLLGCFGPRSDSSTQVERWERKPWRADCGSQVPRAATHGGYQRNRHRLVPASSEAKASLACEGRTLVGCARVSMMVAEVGKLRRGSEKRVSGGNGTRGRETGPWWLARGSRSEKASISCIAAAKSRCKRSPKPGVREGVAGRRSLLDGRHPGWLRQRASFTRARCGRSWRPSRRRNPRERFAPHEGGDRGCQRLGLHASRREDNAHRDDS
jgi:hypothetical protein